MDNELNISKDEIREYLSDKEAYLETFDIIESTNTYAKSLIRELASEGKVIPRRGLICAEAQTAGRGRQGKSFLSLKENGIYMSLIMDIHKDASEILFMTSAAAVAVTRVLERFSDSAAKIKWINDIYIGDKKTCGILSEAVNVRQAKGTGAELDRSLGSFIDYLVIGIGMNVKTSKSHFPDELSDIAASVSGVTISKSRLIAEIANEVFKIYEELGSEELLSEYRQRSMIIGREIKWFENGTWRFGRAVDINHDAHLMVETEEGMAELNAGEVSIKPQ